MAGLADLEGPAGFKEFKPVGRPASSLWSNLFIKLGFGRRYEERRIWVNPEHSDPVLVAVEATHLHCERDVKSLIEAGNIGAELIPEFADLNLEITDLASGWRLFRWSFGSLAFSLQQLPRGSSLLEMLTIARRDADRSLHNSLSAEIVSGIPEIGHRGPCLGFLWQQMFALAYVIPFIGVPIVAAGMLASALLPEPARALALITSMIAIILAYLVWNRRRRFRYLAAAWRRVFTQGDKDGSVRRALASIGVTLSPPQSLE